MFTVFITSGRRPELFRKTVNSFKNILAPYAARWICIDDGTCAEERDKLAREYPFIQFINKTPDQIGHAFSLNEFMPYLDESGKYLIRLEDDWEFVGTENPIEAALQILEECPHIGQVMFNPNYQQTINENLLGGIPAQTSNGLNYLVHDYAATTEEQDAWRKRYGNGPSVLCSWPHFSLQPSLTRTEIFKQIGFFNEASSYFEYQYALEYAKAGWKTAFLPVMHCIHIGRLINDRTGPLNAYELLGQEQFGFPPRLLSI